MTGGGDELALPALSITTGDSFCLLQAIHDVYTANSLDPPIERVLRHCATLIHIMSCRPIIRDLRSRNDIICRSCLSLLGKQPVLSSFAAYSSQATRRARSRPQAISPESISRQPTKAELAQYLQGIQSLQDPEKEKSGSSPFSVRFFEQDEGKRKELPDEEAFGESLSKLDASELKDALWDLKAGLGTQEEKDAFKDVLSEVGGGWNTMRTADDLEKMITKLHAYTDSIDAEIQETGADLPKHVLDELNLDMPELPFMGEEVMSTGGSRSSIPQISEGPWTPNQRKKISRLNLILSRVFKESHRDTGLTKKSVQAVYKAYHSARLALAHGWGNVPLDVWDFLWQVFSAEESINANRFSHVSLLARDMSEAKVTLSPPQQLLTIEAVFVDGWEAKAIDNWKRCIATLGQESAETFQDFWELGVRMHCRAGDMEQAERAVNRLLQRNMSPRILMPLIRACCEQDTGESRDRAWAAYRQMRELLGRDMKLSDYDQVVSYFLTTNQVENALYAFVDMMSDGQIDLKRQKYMPSVIANKFFLGKWLKRLIGAGDLDGALSVVEFMRQKGVEAAPIHLNGLIGAWQRSGGADDLEKADVLAWEMIEARVKFVRARKEHRGSKVAFRTSDMASLPRATLETFSLLAENYRLRDLHSRLEALWDAFHDAEISPDAFMINQLLESHIQAGQPKEAMALYHSLVTGRGVAPDPYTFSALWKTLAVNRLHVVPSNAMDGEIEATRALFKETVKFKSIFSPDGMDGQLARKILHTFRRLKDNAGFLVALTALKDLFGFLPPETLAMEMVLGTTKLSWDTPPQRRRLMIAKREMDRELLAWAEGDADKLEGENRGAALYEYLQKKYWPQLGAEADKRKALVGVAKEMGVYELLAPKRKADSTK